jgi:hypothetical protein
MERTSALTIFARKRPTDHSEQFSTFQVRALVRANIAKGERKGRTSVGWDVGLPYPWVVHSTADIGVFAV